MKTGETFAPLRARGEDFEDWIGAGLGLDARLRDVRDVVRGQPLPEVSAVAGVVITGSPAMLTDAAPWNAIAAQWLREAHITHSQSLLELPPTATLLASSAHDRHQAYRVGARAWGVQFHPEFSAEVMRTYVRERQQALQAEGFDVEALLRDEQETPAASKVLRRFAALCGF